jgi:large subunit ribosomal protein L35
VTGSGKLLRRHAMKSHNLEKKSATRRRAFGQDHAVDGSDAREVRRLLGR